MFVPFALDLAAALFVSFRNLASLSIGPTALRTSFASLLSSSSTQFSLLPHEFASDQLLTPILGLICLKFEVTI